MQRVKDVLTILKRELMELIENLNVVKIWIQLNIPRIEDGNNFGVGVQVLLSTIYCVLFHFCCLFYGYTFTVLITIDNVGRDCLRTRPR